MTTRSAEQTPQPSDGLLSAVRLLKSWRYPEDLPEGIPPLKPILAEAEGYLTPMGPKAAAVLLDRLFSVLPRPSDDALPHWLSIIGGYPVWAAEPAVADLIRSYRFGRPPLPAELISLIEANPTFVRRRTMLGRLRSAEMKQRLDALPALEALKRVAIAGPVRQAAQAMKAPRPEVLTEADFQRKRAEVLRQCEAAGMVVE
jgi:hypothetical protein